MAGIDYVTVSITTSRHLELSAATNLQLQYEAIASSLHVISYINENMRSRSPHSDMDDEELFAELEAEIENDESAIVRERGIEQYKLE